MKCRAASLAGWVIVDNRSACVGTAGCATGAALEHHDHERGGRLVFDVPLSPRHVDNVTCKAAVALGVSSATSL